MKPSLVSLAALVSVLVHAADTARNIETINDGESVVTAVDHTKLVNGTTEVVANADGTASIVAPGSGEYGNPIFTIHAGSVFTGDTAAHSKTFTEDYVVDFTGVDLSGGSPPFLEQDGWRFIGPTDDNPNKTLWCGPTDYPSWEFSLSNYDSGSPTVAFSPYEGSEFTGTITSVRPAAAVASTIATLNDIDSHQWDWTQVTNKPSIPSAANNGTLTIQRNGKQVVSFEANQSSNSTFNVRSSYYATCSTAESTASKAASLKDSGETFVLEEGVVVYVKFDNGPAQQGTVLAANTLNVAGTGAKQIRYNNGGPALLNNGSCSAWRAGSIVGFIYDGTYWRMLRAPVAYTGVNGWVDGVVRLSNLFDNSTSVVPRNDVLYKVGTSIAPYWVKNSSTAYSAGDLVMYNDGKLYRAKNNIAANTAWAAANWQETTVRSEISIAATNITKAVISNAVANVNVNIQSAEDARVALTNLITILKNL